jgi:hypothetical protein
MYMKCQKCGKKLTDPDSVKRGYGPECWGSIVGNYRNVNSNSEESSEDVQIPGQMDIFEFPELLPEEG